MAHENDDSWGATPKIIDETIRVTRKFLQEYLDLHTEVEVCKWSKEAKKISLFLGDNWSERKVYYSLQRLGLIEKEQLDKEAIESLPTDKAAQRFTSAVKSIEEIAEKKMDYTFNRKTLIYLKLKRLLRPR